MPEATPELRETMLRRFGNAVDDRKPIAWMEERGWKLRPDWRWQMPSDNYLPTDEEWDVINFLFQEWDMGGVAT